MLKNCPECNQQVSTKAFLCPHCGYPLKKNSARLKPKRMRLPNGFGQISELKDKNLRKPFRAMVTIGKTDEGRPICKLLQPEAYFATYNDAYSALMEYNKDPSYMSNNMTVAELYAKWYDIMAKTSKPAVMNSTKMAWNYCQSTLNMKVRDIRPRHIRYCMEEQQHCVNGEYHTASLQVKQRIKSIFNKMLDYAVECEIVDRNYSRAFVVRKTLKDMEDEENVSSHIPYSDEEMEKLWANINAYYCIDVILVQCYTGMRPRELEILEIKNINLEEGIMTAGVKTKAGINRTIPIHPRILPIITKHYNDSVESGWDYLFAKVKLHKRITYSQRIYYRELSALIDALNLNKEHRPHDGRVHFITQAKKYNMDEFAIKRIVGHKILDITESVYTKRDTSWLIQEMQKIK